jgi:hypothetical protein
MLFRKLIAVYRENPTEHKVGCSGKTWDFLNGFSYVLVSLSCVLVSLQPSVSELSIAGAFISWPLRIFLAFYATRHFTSVTTAAHPWTVYRAALIYSTPWSRIFWKSFVDKFDTHVKQVIDTLCWRFKAVVIISWSEGTADSCRPDLRQLQPTVFPVFHLCFQAGPQAAIHSVVGYEEVGAYRYPYTFFWCRV